MDLSDRVRVAREARGLTKEALEKKAGLSRGYLSYLETKKRGAKAGVGTERLARLADALAVRLEWLITGTEPMELAHEEAELPNRALALAIAREGGVPEAVLRMVLELKPERADERTTLWWIEEIQLRQALLRRDTAPESREPTTAPPKTHTRRRGPKGETG